jgi:hypothetical protein
MEGQMGKHDGRRHSKHALWYDNHFDKLKKCKDRNVKRSSHGKFATVAELVKHQTAETTKRGAA